jgi:hypothetical protein
LAIEGNVRRNRGFGILDTFYLEGESTVTMSERACPKCGCEQPDYHTECTQCGVVFAKYTAEYDSFLRAQASGTLHPTPPRVRPLTLVLLLAYLGVGWYAIDYYEVTDKLVLLSGAEEGISSGGTFTLRKRSRIELPAVSPSEDESAVAACHGVVVYPDATLVSDRTSVPDAAGQVLYETEQTLDDVLAFYASMLGKTRLIRAPIEVPSDSPIVETRSEVPGRHARWFVRTLDPAGAALDVDLELHTPFFDADGSFNPDATLISLVDRTPVPPTD